LAEEDDTLDDFSDTVDLTGALDEAREGSGLAMALAGLPAGGCLLVFTDFAGALEPVAVFGLAATLGTDFKTGFHLDLGDDLEAGLVAFLATGFLGATGFFLATGLDLETDLDFGAGLDFDLAMTGVFFWGC